jgi:hypothetical protein
MVKTLCQVRQIQQLSFFVKKNRHVLADFKGGEITSDGGLVILYQFDERLGLTRQISDRITDSRTTEKVSHRQLGLLRQRIYQIIAGYEDADDSDLLRNDPLFKLTAGEGELSKPLASQPTMSRLENRVTAREVVKVNRLLLNWFVQKHRPAPPKEIILDVDSTDDPAHGKQQLALFNGAYDQYMYYPILVYEGNSGDLLATRLRRGNSGNSERILQVLKPLVKRLRAAFPECRILLRADAGFATRKLYRFCEEHSMLYVIGFPSYKVLKRRAEPSRDMVKRRYEKTGRSQKRFTSFRYRAGSWKRSRRILVKAEHNCEGENLRFVVTNMRGLSRRLFHFYNQRSGCENWIKELKLGFRAERLSCHDFVANAFRLALCGLSYGMVHWFRQSMASPELKKAQIDTLRLRLFKIGAWIRQTVRNIWIHFASGWPYRNLLRSAYQSVIRIRAGPSIA